MTIDDDLLGRELGVTIDDDLLGIKLAAALPRDVISVSSVMADLDQLVTQFECDENEGSVDGSETALPANERSWCDFCKKSVWHTTAMCFKNPLVKRKKSANDNNKAKALNKVVKDAVHAYIACQSKDKKTKKAKAAIF